MPKLILLLLTLASVGARAELKITGVRWTAADVVNVAVADGVNEPVEVEASLKDPTRNPGRAGPISVAVQDYAVPAAGGLKTVLTLNQAPFEANRNLMTLIIRKQGVDLASLYVLRETPDRQYEYAHGRPFLDSSADIAEHLKEILRGLKALNTCADSTSLEAMTAFLKARPDQQINDFHSRVETGKIKTGENGSCAVIDDPPKSVAPVAKTGAPKPAKSPGAAAPAPPRARAPRLDAYGNPIPTGPTDPYRQRRDDGYADPYGPRGGGYDPRGAYDQRGQYDQRGAYGRPNGYDQGGAQRYDPRAGYGRGYGGQEYGEGY